MTPNINRKAVRLVERAIIKSSAYETKKRLWARLQGRIKRNSFEDAITTLRRDGKIVFDGLFVIYTGVDNPKLRAMVASSAIY